MRRAQSLLLAACLLAYVPADAQPAPATIPVTVDNFVRAESDTYFASIARDNGFGRFNHTRELSPLEDQKVIRLNRDTLYSSAVFDLDAGPVTITLPNAGKRLMSMQVINEDHYTFPAIYAAGPHTLTRSAVGTRYVAVALRTLVNPKDPADLAAVHALQDAVKVKQPGGPGTFAVPAWDTSSQKTIRDALLVLAAGVKDTSRSFGTRGQVDPIQHLIGSASAWGANPPKDATYLNFTPARNDGSTVYRLTVKDVPVDGFWSVSVYNANGFYEKNALDAYTLNNVTASKAADGSTTIQFGGCTPSVQNCLPITNGWNYMVRLYRPRADILDGHWHFPEAKPVS
ncbi:MAG: DUF1254 domain-containing protein [Proteobacteria bacterium]|nr:DUF1254 domain-containing protein [Pseudomonadota bacterium]